MQVLIDVEEKNLDALKNSNVPVTVIGTDKDMLLSTVFGKGDIEAFVDNMLTKDLYSSKYENFANELQHSNKTYNKLVDDVFHRLNEYFDANVGINNDLIELTMDSVFREHAKSFEKAKDESFGR